MCRKVIPWAQAGIAGGSAIGYAKMHIPREKTDGTMYIQPAVIV